MDKSLQRERYLELLTGHLPHEPMLCCLHDATPDGVVCKRSRLDSVEQWLERMQGSGHGVFCLVNESGEKERRRGKDVVGIRAIWIDIDGSMELPELPLEPTMVVRTRNGHHIYYVLHSLFANIEWGVGMNRTLARKYGGDPGAVDAARILRVPGYQHLKKGPWPVELVQDSGERYDPEELEIALGAPEAAVVRSYDKVPREDSDAQDTPWGLAAAIGEGKEIEASQVGGRNHQINRSAFKLGQIVGGSGLREETAREKLESSSRKLFGESLDYQTMQTISSGLSAGMAEARENTKEPSKYVEPVHTVSILNREGLADRLEAEIDRRIERGFLAAPGPMKCLNKALGGGIPAGAVTLLGAPPGMGKSSLALHWADTVADTGRPVLFCSLELSELDLYARLTTLRHKLPWIKVRQGEHKRELMVTIRSAVKSPLYSISRHNLAGVSELSVYIDDLSQKYGKPPMVVIDYLQLLMPVGETREQWAVMADISGEVAHCAQDSGSPIMCITAVNRQSYNVIDKATGKPDKYMAMAAAKQSGRLEYDAEVILGMQLGGVVEGGQFGWICIAKNRSGGAATDIGCKYDGLSGKFTSASDEDVYNAVEEEKNMRKRSRERRIKDHMDEFMERKSNNHFNKEKKDNGVQGNFWRGKLS